MKKKYPNRKFRLLVKDSHELLLTTRRLTFHCIALEENERDFYASYTAVSFCKNYSIPAMNGKSPYGRFAVCFNEKEFKDFTLDFNLHKPDVSILIDDPLQITLDDVLETRNGK